MSDIISCYAFVSPGFMPVQVNVCNKVLFDVCIIIWDTELGCGPKGGLKSSTNII